MIKAILFDFFDVIRQDSFQAWMFNHGYTRNDEPGNISRRMDTGLISVEKFRTEIAALTGQTIEELMSEFEENEKFDQAVIDYIAELKKTYKIGLLSNSESNYLRRILSEQQLQHLFDEIVISGEVGHAKPDAEFFEIALNKFRVNPDEVIFIDDQQRNIDAANILGIVGICYKNIQQLRTEMEQIVD